MKLEKIFSGDRDMVSDDTFGYSKRLASGECLNFPGRFGIAIKSVSYTHLDVYKRQVMIHSRIAEELGYFTIHDVVDGVCEKMIRRHPHVFGDAVAETPEESLALWRAIKKQEKAKKP